MIKQKNEITFKELFNIFLPKWWLILIISLLCGSVLGFYSMIKPDSYTSTEKYMIYKTNYNDNNAQTGFSSAEAEAMQIIIENLNETMKTSNFANNVKDILAGEEYGITGYGTTDIKNMMSLKLTTTGTGYYFSVTAKNPEHAYKIANFAGQLLIEEYEENSKYSIKIVKVDDAVVPRVANSKNITRNAIIGFAGGLVASLVIVFILSRFDVIIRNRDKLEDNYNLPILGVIPRLEIDS